MKNKEIIEKFGEEYISHRIDGKNVIVKTKDIFRSDFFGKNIIKEQSFILSDLPYLSCPFRIGSKILFAKDSRLVK
jgi:hypothetical protein